MSRDRLPPALLIGLVLLAGCLGGAGSPAETTEHSPTTSTESSPPSSSTPAATPTPFPDTVVPFPDGPKERPDRPTNLTAETVSEFVRVHEYRYVYNRLWYGDATEVSVNCEVRSVERVGDGYRAVVGCSGYSNTRGTPGPNATGTATAVHADYFTRYYAYLVDDDSLVRREATAAERPGSDGNDTSAAPTSRPADASDGRCPAPTCPTSVESASV